MTHYARDECFHNNKNDALSTNSRPINNSSTFNYDEKKSGAYPYNEYGVSDEYASEVDWPRGDVQFYGDRSFNQNYAHYTDDYSSEERHEPVVASGEYWDENSCAPNQYGVVGGYEYDDATMVQQNGCGSTAKNADDVPIEGTYRRRGNRFGVRLPAAPAMDNSKYRMLPHAVAYQNVHAHNNLNGHSGYAPNAGLIDERIGSFISLPAAPMRMLPEPQQRPRSSSHQLFEDDNLRSNDASGNQNVSDGDFQNSSFSIGATGTPGTARGTTSTYDVFCQMARPYTSMLPLDYTDYTEYGCNSDNLSAYSDTPPMSNAQHKLQQQRKISLMMAMTTASVIASGETRVPVQQTHRRTDNYTAVATVAEANISIYASSSSFSSVAFTNATAIASERWSKRDATTMITTTTTTTTTATTTTTTTPTARKLPKRLPSPAVQYKSSLSHQTTTTHPASVSEVYSDVSSHTQPQPEKNHRVKQLPKLPMPKAKPDANSVPISSDSTINRKASIIPSAISINSSPDRLSTMASNSPISSDSAKNFRHLEEDQMQYEKPYGGIQFHSDVPRSVDSFRSWSSYATHPASPPLFPSELSGDKQPAVQPASPIRNTLSELKPVVLESSSVQALPISKHYQSTITTETTTTALSEAKTSTFDISEYLKPYTFDSLKFPTDNQNDHITSNDFDLYASDKKDPLELLKLTSLESQMQNSITTWTASPINIGGGGGGAVAVSTPSKDEMVITPLSESSSTLSYLLSKPNLPLTLTMEGVKSDQHAASSVSHDTVTTIGHLGSVLTTTVIASSPSTMGITSPGTSPAAASMSASIMVNSPTLSYVDYMKKFELPELPPILDICNSDGVSAIIPERSTPDIVTTTTASSAFRKFSTSTITETDTITSTTAMPSHTQTTESSTQQGRKFSDEFQRNHYETETPAWLNVSNLADISQLPEITSTDAKLDSGISFQPESQPETLPDFSMSHIDEPLGYTTSAFDDSFYDSFNVDLSALTATVAHIESDTCLTPAVKVNGNEFLNNLSTVNSINSQAYIDATETENCLHESNENSGFSQGGYYKPPQKQQTSVTDEPPPTPQKAKVVASAATSVLGGLSKGIKGGLDGVLSGVSSTIEATKQIPASNTSKKGGFGFGLASKLVPSVGGLLSSSSSSSSSKQEQQEAISITSTASTTTAPVENNQILNSKSTPYVYDYAYEYNQLPDNANTNMNVSEPLSPTCEYLGGPGNIQNNVTVDYLGNVDADRSRIEAMGFDDEYSYSEYPVNYEGPGEAHEGIYNYTDLYKVSASSELELGSDMIDTIPCNQYGTSLLASNLTAVQKPFPPEIETGAEANKSQGLSSKMGIKKGGTTSNASSTGGMLGSIFGKAAAAVQSATQAVNQGASSVASVVAQKTTAPTAVGTTVSQTKPRDSPAVASSSIQIAPLASNATSSAGYHMIMDNDFNELVTSNQDTVSSQFSTAGDDYENSNTHMLAGEVATIDNKAYSIYYSDSDQSQPTDIQAIAGQKLLPTVPSAGSTGKRLPTINGKSVLLIKQQPTEIFDDESDNDEIIDDFIGQPDKAVDHEPIYGIDSEQDDYYMDHQQTTPSSRVANDYYEHVNTGYDYREDFFNEEDEYKYLEQQTQQQQQQQQQHQQFPHQMHKMMLSQKQSSLDFVDDRQNDDFLNETYPSDEDCGNYLDESSSGSVGIAESRKPRTEANGFFTVTTTSMSTPAIVPGEHTALRATLAANNSLHLSEGHQPIKKQDSIIIEEDESAQIDLENDLRVAGQRSPELDADDDDDDDKLADLIPTRSKSQKKKMLMRGETEEVVSGHMIMLRKPEITAKQRWHWAYNKIIMQLNVSTIYFLIHKYNYI